MRKTKNSHFRALTRCFLLLFSHNGYFVDLYVRVSNKVAIGMYQKMGYVRYRTVLGYYSGEEDAWGARSSSLLLLSILRALCTFADMRKALPRDKDKKSLIAKKDVVTPDEVD